MSIFYSILFSAHGGNFLFPEAPHFFFLHEARRIPLREAIGVPLGLVADSYRRERNEIKVRSAAGTERHRFFFSATSEAFLFPEAPRNRGGLSPADGGTAAVSVRRVSLSEGNDAVFRKKKSGTLFAGNSYSIIEKINQIYKNEYKR